MADTRRASTGLGLDAPGGRRALSFGGSLGLGGARVAPRGDHTPSRAARPSLATPSKDAAPSPSAFLSLSHRRLVIDPEARSTPGRRTSRPFGGDAPSSHPAIEAAPAPAPALLGPPPPPASGLAAPPTLLALSPNGGPPPASARSS